MIDLNQVEDQLQKVGCNFRFWGRPEIRELCQILMPDEVIMQAVNGRYEGGFALLCVTNHRLLLIDKKPMFLALEDIRFDMISEIDYSARLLDGVIHIITPHRKLTFLSWSHQRLRALLHYTQQRIMELRQHFLMQQFQPDPQVTVSFVGGLAMQAHQGGGGVVQRALPMNPYTKVPLLTRRRQFPRFY